ncbi:MAG: glycerate kinase, partial [Cyanobacteria bacterium]|nr:glycerate kinase [Cyanobacteriota bacterium]
DVEFLEEGMTHFAEAMEKVSGASFRDIPGAGAAGGVPFGLVSALGASIIPGFGWLCDFLSLEEKVAAADLVIGAEGRLDSQSLEGKALGDLARLCRKHGVKFGIVPALVTDEKIDWKEHGVDVVVPTARPGSIARLDDVRAGVAQLLNFR